MSNKKEEINNVGDSVIASNANCKFSGNIIKNFRNHIRKSIPMYDKGHNLICKLSDFFIKNDSICYEI